MNRRGLSDLQGTLARMIAGPLSLVVEGRPEGEIEQLVKPSTRGMTPEARLEVYREQFWMRHLENLQDDFPTLIWVMGGLEPFRELACSYLVAHPPRHWDLQRLGEGLPGHVAASQPWSSDAMTEAAARLDWAFVEAFDSPDAAPIDARSLAAIPEGAWPLATMMLHPSLHLLELDYPLQGVRSDVAAGRTPTRPEKARSHVAVWRDQSCVLQALPVEAGAFVILLALQKGAGLGVACEAAVRGGPIDGAVLEEKVGAWFQEWTSRGWISSVTPPQPR